MAVYTKINQKEINIINKNFNIDKVINFKGIKQGIENTNYLLKSKKRNRQITKPKKITNSDSDKVKKPKNEKNKMIFDYQLERALDLIRGISLYKTRVSN